MTYYVVGRMREEAEGTINGMLEVKIKLEWAKGQIGALPVFLNKEDAIAFADGKSEIIKIQG